MNKIINFSLKNKFAVWLLTIIVTIAGIYSGLNMKLETIPDITTPVVTVTTVYPGATPEEVADKVSKPMEEQLQNLSGVNVVSSSSFQNASSIQVEYDFDKNMEKAETEIKRSSRKCETARRRKGPESFTCKLQCLSCYFIKRSK